MRIIIALCCCMISCFMACKKTEPPQPINPLIGTWKVSAIQLNSTTTGIVDAVVSGTIKFNEDGTGQENYTWTALGITVNENNGFRWIETPSSITFDPGENHQTIWTRLVNLPNEQRGSRERVENNVNFTVTTTLTQ